MSEINLFLREKLNLISGNEALMIIHLVRT